MEARSSRRAQLPFPSLPFMFANPGKLLEFRKTHSQHINLCLLTSIKCNHVHVCSGIPRIYNCNKISCAIPVQQYPIKLSLSTHICNLEISHIYSLVYNHEIFYIIYTDNMFLCAVNFNTMSTMSKTSNKYCAHIQHECYASCCAFTLHIKRLHFIIIARSCPHKNPHIILLGQNGCTKGFS